MTKAVDKMVMEQAKTTVYLLVNIQFEMRQKELMKTCKTSDEIAIKVLENVLLTIKDNSLSPKQLRSIRNFVNGEEKLEDDK
jgi:hypothetical protein